MSLLQIHEPGQTPAPHAEAEDASIAIGVDLGTTHSVVAASCDGRPVALGMPGDFIIPSIVSYLDDSVAVGNEAKAANDAIHSIKRRMDNAADTLMTAQGEKTPVEVSAEILKVCKLRAQEMLDTEVKKAVITVPAYFDDAARTATRDAARLAGLEVLRLINEPTAAALAYGLDSQAEGVYAIYDLGGGTFDMSVLRLSQGVFQVLATGGDTRLGGDDIDAAIAEHCGCSPQDARRLKEALSSEESITLTFEGKECALTAEELKELSKTLISRTLTISESVLHDAQIDIEAIQGVVLVGGSTRMPLVREAVEEYFKQSPFSDLDPDQLVALGAALQAEALTVGSENLLLDVTPLSLGLETMGGIVEKVIHRNTPIPVSKAQEFTTYQDGQTAMNIKVVQGEREMVADCRELAEFTLSGIPPMAANVARIKVMFTVDADGLLTVSASEETTGAQTRVEVKPTYGLSVDDMEKMLRDSMENAREDITHRLLVEARVEAGRLIEDLTSALAKDADVLTEEERSEIDIQLEALRGALEAEDREIIDAQTMALDAVCQVFAQKRMDKAIGSALKGKDIKEIG